jgi:protein TonB
MMTTAEGRLANAGGPGGLPPEVPFPLLEAIGLDVAPRGGRAREFILATAFATAHLSVLLALRWAQPAATAPLADLGTATYLDIPPPTAVESPRRVAKPRPVGVSSAVTVPAMQGDVVRPDKAAGFQELLTPKDLGVLPPPDPGGKAVDEKDFTGRGVVGGVAGGKPPPVIAADIAAQMAREGQLSDVVETVRESFHQKPVSMEMVTVRPELLNRDEMRVLLLKHYPPALRQAGVEGSAMVQFVVDTNGRVDPQSVTVVSTTNALFATAAIEVIKRARFSPGRFASEGEMQAVPVSVRVPLTWTLAK